MSEANNPASEASLAKFGAKRQFFASLNKKYRETLKNGMPYLLITGDAESVHCIINILSSKNWSDVVEYQSLEDTGLIL